MEEEQRLSGCKRCRSWEHDLYWNHFTSIHFFLLLPHDFRHHLVLPPKFGKNMKAKLPDKVCMIGPSACVWELELKKTETVEFGGDGWVQFVKAHELQEDNLLMFKYQRNSGFEVLIFDLDSFCEKEASYFIKQCDCSNHGNKAREEDGNGKKRKLAEAFGMENTVEHEDSGKSKAQSEDEPRQSGDVHDVVDEEAEENGAAGERSHVSETHQNTMENGQSVPQTYPSFKSSKKRGGPKKRVLPKSSRKLQFQTEQEPEGNGAGSEQNHVSEREQNAAEIGGNILEGVESQSSAEKESELRPQDPAKFPSKLVLESDSAEKKYSRRYKSNRRPVTDMEKENALERAVQAQGMNEKSFFAVMKRSAVYMRFYLSLPSVWTKEHLGQICRKCRVTLRVGEKTWGTVFYCNSRKEGGLSGNGWKKFAVDNYLEEFDVCLFKLASKEDDPDIVMDVDIFRVIPEIVPLTPIGRLTPMMA